MNMGKKLLAASIGALVSTAALADGVSITNNPLQTEAAGTYWTAERMASAKTLLPKRDGSALSAESYGSSVLDFTRSRIFPSKSLIKVKPYKSVGKLYFTIPGQGNYQCTASVIKKRLIVTAAHCMYSDGIGFHTNWQFIPGFDGTLDTGSTGNDGSNPGRPYGTWNWAYGIVHTNWISSHGALPNNEDFGILQMVDQASGGSSTVKTVGSTVGTLTPLVNRLANNMITMLGYPCNFDSCAIMQRNDGSDYRSSGVSGSTAYEYGSDMTGGSSGGPWVQNFGDPTAAAPTGGWTERNAVVGVTSYGYNDPAVLILGSSGFNANFTSILNTACSNASGNC